MTIKLDVYDDVESFSLVNLTRGYRLNDFQCLIPEYSKFLLTDALEFQELNIARTYLLINKNNADVVSYMSLVSDSIKLSNDERTRSFPDNIRFNSFPAIKIGKLAVDAGYAELYKGIGSMMIELARGIAQEINESVSCKFITVDADVQNGRELLEFYKKNSFVLNESYPHGDDRRTISMRLNVFADEDVEEISA